MSDERVFKGTLPWLLDLRLCEYIKYERKAHSAGCVTRNQVQTSTSCLVDEFVPSTNRLAPVACRHRRFCTSLETSESL
eukprot:6199488-Pleurochrysis_carterae.AAC.4